MIQLEGYVDADGTFTAEATDTYIGTDGYTTTLADAIDVRGAGGADADVERFSVHTDGDRRVIQLEGYVDSGGTFTAEATATYLGTDGYTTTLADAVDMRGATGADGAGSTGGGGVVFVNESGVTQTGTLVSLTPTDAWTEYGEGDAISFVSETSSTGNVNIDVSGLGEKDLLFSDGTEFLTSDLPDDLLVTATYDGTAFRTDIDKGLDLSRSSNPVRIVSSDTDVSTTPTSFTLGQGLSEFDRNDNLHILVTEGTGDDEQAAPFPNFLLHELLDLDPIVLPSTTPHPVIVLHGVRIENVDDFINASHAHIHIGYIDDTHISISASHAMGDHFEVWVVPRIGKEGPDGATARLSVHVDGERRVLQVEGHVDADGVFTAVDSDTYVADDGFTTVLADAVDIRGATEGVSGASRVLDTTTTIGTTITAFDLVDSDGDAVDLTDFDGNSLVQLGFRFGADNVAHAAMFLLRDLVDLDAVTVASTTFEDRLAVRVPRVGAITSFTTGNRSYAYLGRVSNSQLAVSTNVAVGGLSWFIDIIPITGPVGDTGGDGMPGSTGPAGATPRFSIHSDGARRVVQLEGYVDADGAFTAEGTATYIADDGYTTTIADAIDVRGDAGADADVERFSVHTDGDRRVIQLEGYVDSGGTFTAQATDTYLGETGFVTAIADAIDVRGPIGATGAAAVFYVDETDVGGTADAIDLTHDDITSYSAGMAVAFKAGSDNTGLVMVEIGSLGAVSLRKADNTEFLAGELTEDRMIIMVYDGTRFLSNVEASETAGAKVYYVAPEDFSQNGNVATMTIPDFPGYKAGQIFAFVAEATNTGNVNLKVNSESYHFARRHGNANFAPGEFVNGTLYFLMFTGLVFRQVGYNVDDETIDFNSDGDLHVKDRGIGFDQMATGTEGKIIGYNSSDEPVDINLPIIHVTPTNVSHVGNAITLTVPSVTAYAIGQRFSFISEGVNTANMTLRVNSLSITTFRRADEDHWANGQFQTNRLYIVTFDGARFRSDVGDEILPTTVDDDTISLNTDGEAQIKPEGVGDDELADGTEGNVTSYNASSRPVSRPLRAPGIFFYGDSQTDRIDPLRSLGSAGGEDSRVFMRFDPTVQDQTTLMQA